MTSVSFDHSEMLDNLPDGMCRCSFSAKNEIVYFNKTFKSIFGAVKNKKITLLSNIFSDQVVFKGFIKELSKCNVIKNCEAGLVRIGKKRVLGDFISKYCKR